MSPTGGRRADTPLTTLQNSSAPTRTLLVLAVRNAALLAFFAGPPPLEAQSLDWNRIAAHIRVLADDSLQGRGTTQPGGRKAAGYIASVLQRDGLRPVAKDRRWEQGFPAHASVPLETTTCAVSASDEFYSLKLWEDFILLAHGNQTFISRGVRLLFVGYGIDAPEYHYSDYRSIDVRGSIVVMLTGEPPSEDPRYFDGQRPTPHASLLSKHREALARGARGTIVIPTEREPVFGGWEEWTKEFLFEDVRLPYGPPDQLHLVLNPGVAKRIFASEGSSFDLLLRADSIGSLRPFSLDAHLTFDGRFVERDDWVSNIAAIIPGTDERFGQTTVIVGAHYDHLGIGPVVRKDSIYNGCLDNAVGVAVTLEIARILRSEENPLNRSVLVLFFTGEEKGLLGSRYYVDHPLRPLDGTVAMVNIDGVSTIDRVRSFIPVGSELSTLQEEVGRVLTRHRLTAESIPALFAHQNPLVSSDHWSFMQAGIPALLLSESLSYESAGDDGVRAFLRYAGEVYHSPFDDLSISISEEAVMQHAHVLLDLIRGIANADTPPRWNEGIPFENARGILEKEGE